MPQALLGRHRQRPIRLHLLMCVFSFEQPSSLGAVIRIICGQDLFLRNLLENRLEKVLEESAFLHISFHCFKYYFELLRDAVMDSGKVHVLAAQLRGGQLDPLQVSLTNTPLVHLTLKF